MAAVIRLTRKGCKKNAFFRIGVFDKRKSRDSNYIEDLGFYNPKSEPEKIKLNKERAEYWIGVGAKPSDTVKSILKKNGVRV